MRAEKILYVDDESMALKYFERLVGPLAPILTATSVAEGKRILDEQGPDIAVLVSDQRMPGAFGNELLRYAREQYPLIVRILTTAYSDLDEAIEAINTGEIYRYITKPWDMDHLRADLKNALELSALRRERDGLLREKILVHRQLLLSSRTAQMAVSAGMVSDAPQRGLFAWLESAVAARCRIPAIDWNLQDQAQLSQAESHRSIAIGRMLLEASTALAAAGSGPSMSSLAACLEGRAVTAANGDGLILDTEVLTELLHTSTKELPSRPAVAWLAWLLRVDGRVNVRCADGRAHVRAVAETPAGPLPAFWMAESIDRLGLLQEEFSAPSLELAI